MMVEHDCWAFRSDNEELLSAIAIADISKRLADRRHDRAGHYFSVDAAEKIIQKGLNSGELVRVGRFKGAKRYKARLIPPISHDFGSLQANSLPWDGGDDTPGVELVKNFFKGGNL